MTYAPFGRAAPSAGEPGQQSLAEIAKMARLATAGTVPEAVRRCRRAATGIGASGFALFFTGRGTTEAMLVPCFDEGFPGLSPRTEQLAASAADVLSAHALQSALPARWGKSGNAAPARTPYVMTLALPATEFDGVAFPVTAESGQTALFVFTGCHLAVADEDLLQLHHLCFEMFNAIAMLKTGSTSSAAALSNRELECLRLTAAGRTSDDIARILGLSAHTANQYLTAAAVKLDAVNRMHAVAKAMRLGLID